MTSICRWVICPHSISRLLEDMGQATAQVVDEQTGDGFAAESATIFGKRQR